VPDNPVGHGPSSDAVRATRRCYPAKFTALTASYGSMDGSANLSCLRAERSDKVMFSGGFIRARPGANAPLITPSMPPATLAGNTLGFAAQRVVVVTE